MVEDSKPKRAERLRGEIADIATRPRQVRFDEIEQLVRRLGEFIDVRSRPIRHGVLFTVSAERFSIVFHNRGDSHLKRVYVRSFLDAMARIGWFEDET